MPSTAGALALRDLDVNGAVDLLAVDAGVLPWWHGKGTGAFGGPLDRAAGPSPHHPALTTSGCGPGPDVVVANGDTPFAQVSYLTNASTPLTGVTP